MPQKDYRHMAPIYLYRIYWYNLLFSETVTPHWWLGNEIGCPSSIYCPGWCKSDFRLVAFYFFWRKTNGRRIRDGKRERKGEGNKNRLRNWRTKKTCSYRGYDNFEIFCLYTTYILIEWKIRHEKRAGAIKGETQSSINSYWAESWLVSHTCAYVCMRTCDFRVIKTPTLTTERLKTKKVIQSKTSLWFTLLWHSHYICSWLMMRSFPLPG